MKPFLCEDKDKDEYKVIPLSGDVQLDSAFRTGQFHSQSCGVVLMRSGLGLRVVPSEFDSMLKQVRPDDAERFLGSKFEVSGLPLSIGPEGLVAFVAPWSVAPIASFRKGFCRT